MGCCQAARHRLAWGVENLIHRIFDPARLDIEIKDRFGQPVIPREWFLVPLFVIDEAVEKIRDGTITGYIYNPNTSPITRGAGEAGARFPVSPAPGADACRLRRRSAGPDAAFPTPCRPPPASQRPTWEAGPSSQCAIASTSSSLVRGPSTDTERITIAMHAATNKKTPLGPNSRRKYAMKNGVKIPLSLLHE